MVYKLELPTRWKIYDIFHALLLEQNTIRKRRVDKLLELKLELDRRKDNKYEFEAIKNSAVYAKAIESQLLG